MSSMADRTVVRLKNFRAADVGDNVSKVLGGSARRLRDSAQSLSSKAQGAARGANGLIRANPWQTAGLIALAGLAAGIVVSRNARARRAAADADSSSEISGG